MLVRLRASVRAASGLAALSLVAACGGDSTGPELTDVELRAVSGSAQFGPPGGALDEPFRVEVRSLTSAKPRDGVEVTFEVTEGAGASLSRRTAVTDDQGVAASTLTLGSAEGIYRVRASVPGARGSPVEFWARAVGTPVLASVPGAPVAPDETVTLEGEGFIPEADLMVVTFGGVRGPTLEATATTLRVRVPACLPPGPVDVVVALGDLRSQARELTVAGEGPTLALPPGGVHTVDDAAALSCLRLPSDPDAAYLAAVHSTSTLGAAIFDYGLALREGSTEATAPASAGPRGAEPTPSGPQARWDRRVRALERSALRVRARPTSGARTPVPSAVPEPGDTRDFQVLNAQGGFEDVTAEVRYVGERSVIYVDRDAPKGGFDSADLAAIGGDFDDPIHPVVTGAYGGESDLDGNQRVVILFTPQVNRLTQRGSDGFVGGFFYGVDLLEGREGSNGGEIFYALVPDPDGEFGDPRSRERVLSTVPAILAHEFQHMVHFNQRVLVLEADGTDALWLSEALATAAEDLVARDFADRGEPGRAWEFREGNYIRALRFFDGPRHVSLVVSAGQGTLAERGAGWLFLRYLEGRTGGVGILRALTRSRRTGVENVEAESGLPWAELVSDWSAALYVDGRGLPVPPALTFRGFDLRAELRRADAEFSPEPAPVASGNRIRVASIRPSATDPLLLEPGGHHGLAVSLGGARGGPSAREAGLRLRLVRLR